MSKNYILNFNIYNIIIFVKFLLIGNFYFGQCHYVATMYDSYGDGWNGAYLEVKRNGALVKNLQCFASFYVDSIYSQTGDNIEFTFYSGSWDNEITFTIKDPQGNVLTSGPAPNNLDNLVHLSNSFCAPSAPCIQPNGLDTLNITSNSADLIWIPGGNESKWNVQYGSNGFLLGNGTIINGINNPTLQVTGLSQSNLYDFYVQANCDSNYNVSSWVGPFTFETKCSTGSCGAYSLKLYDSYGDGWGDGYIEVKINGITLRNFTLDNGSGPETLLFGVDSSDVIDLIYYGSSSGDIYRLYDENGLLKVFQQGTPSSSPVSTFGIIACQENINPSCGELIIEMYDDFCDGWAVYGASIDVNINNINSTNILLPLGCGPQTVNIPVDSGDIVDLVYSTFYQNEHSYIVYDQNGVQIAYETSFDNGNNGPKSTYGIQLCPISTGYIKEDIVNKKKLIGVYNVLGEKVNEKTTKNQILIYFYDDGSYVKKFISAF